MQSIYFHDCPDCGANPGEFHDENCSIDECPVCGIELCEFSCECDGGGRVPWAGAFAPEPSTVCENIDFYVNTDLLKFKAGISCKDSMYDRDVILYLADSLEVSKEMVESEFNLMRWDGIGFSESQISEITDYFDYLWTKDRIFKLMRRERQDD